MEWELNFIGMALTCILENGKIINLMEKENIISKTETSILVIFKKDNLRGKANTIITMEIFIKGFLKKIKSTEQEHITGKMAIAIMEILKWGLEVVMVFSIMVMEIFMLDNIGIMHKMEEVYWIIKMNKNYIQANLEIIKSQGLEYNYIKIKTYIQANLKITKKKEKDIQNMQMEINIMATLKMIKSMEGEIIIKLATKKI